MVTHDAELAADKEALPAFETNGLVEDGLEILNDARSAELDHRHDKGRQPCPPCIILRQHLLDRLAPSHISLCLLHIDLRPDLEELAVREVVVIRCVQSQQDFSGRPRTDL